MSGKNHRAKVFHLNVHELTHQPQAKSTSLHRNNQRVADNSTTLAARDKLTGLRRRYRLRDAIADRTRFQTLPLLPPKSHERFLATRGHYAPAKLDQGIQSDLRTPKAIRLSLVVQSQESRGRRVAGTCHSMSACTHGPSNRQT